MYVGQLGERGYGAKEACDNEGVSERNRSFTKMGRVLPRMLVYSTQKLHIIHEGNPKENREDI
jgi:hypothetical protein